MTPPQSRSSELDAFEEVTKPDYAHVAAETLRLDPVGADSVLLRGPCPRCRCDVDIPVIDSVFRSWWVGRRSVPTQTDSVYPVVCNCRTDHPGRPADRTGCGAYWNLVIVPGGS